jgi:glycosyltransferase involved in cell wall biosynthesis
MSEILFVLWQVGWCGGVRAVFEVANRLARKGYKVRVYALGGEHNWSWFRSEVPVDYVEVPKPLKFLSDSITYLVFRRRNYAPFVLDHVIRKIFNFRVDLIRELSENLPTVGVYIATYYPTALSIYLSRGEGKKLFFLQDFPELVLGNDGIYGLNLFNMVLKLPFEYFLCNSSYTSDLVKSHNPTARTKVVGVGVDLSVFKPRSEKIVTTSKNTVMAFIRGQRFKGDEIAIRALNIINQHLPVHALLVGNEKNIKRVFTLVRPNFSYDVFENPTDEELAKIYSSSDVFIFTSFVESFGLPPLEAMASGTPVVTTDCKGNRDYAVNGYNALIVPPGDPHAIAKAVVQMLANSNLRERLVNAGLITAKQWTWDIVVDRFEEVLKDVLISRSL